MLPGAGAALRNVELRDHTMDITRAMLQGFASESLDNVMESVSSADAAIFVTPVFSASYGGPFKSFIDALEPGADWSTGAHSCYRGDRASLALEFAVRPLFAYLRAVALPTGVFAATGDWGATRAATGGARERGLLANRSSSRRTGRGACRQCPSLISAHDERGSQLTARLSNQRG